MRLKIESFMSFIGLWFLISTLVASHVSSYVVKSPPEAAGIVFDSPILQCLENKPTIEGMVVSPSTEVLDDDTIRLDDRIVFISGLRVRIILDKNGRWEPERFKARGAKAVVVTGVGPGTDGGALSHHVPDSRLCRSLLPMMVYGTSYEAGQNMSALIAKYGNVTARFTPNDYSGWLYYASVWSIPFRLIFTSISGLTATIAFAKLISFIKAFGFRLTVPHVMLMSAFSVTVYDFTFRTIYHALDPIYVGGVFSPSLSQGLMSITFPFDLLGMFLMGLYWNELMASAHVNASQFISRFRYVFFVITAASFVAEIVSSALRATVANFVAAATIIGLIYFAFTLAITSVFFYNGIKVLQYLRATNAASNPRMMNPRAGEKTLRRTSLFLVCSALFNLVWLSGLCMAAVTTFSNTGWGFYSSMTTMWVGISGGALTQVLALKMPPGSKWGAHSHHTSIETLVLGGSASSSSDDPATTGTSLTEATLETLDGSDSMEMTTVNTSI